MSSFKWGKKLEIAATALANGDTQQIAGDKAGVSQRTVQRWLAIPEFSEEVDRLTFMTGVAHKAERLRLAKRIISRLNFTEKDLLDWLKYVQGETDGIKLDLTELLAAVTENGAEMAAGGSGSASSKPPK